MEFTNHTEPDLVFTKKPAVGKRRKATGWEYLGYAGQVGFLVAGPICFGAILGKWIDSSNGSYPRATLIGLGIGFFFSIVGFINFVREIIKKRI